MYVHEKLELPVPAELTLHLEIIKVRPFSALQLFCQLLWYLPRNDAVLQSIRHMCQTLCEIPSTKNAAPLLNYACRTGNKELLLFGLKMGGNLSQVCFLSAFGVCFGA
jgi:hypothetical protein